MVRKALNSVLHQNVDDKQLHTVLWEVEAILNDSPFIKVLNDPSDLEPFTPNHLHLLKGKAVLPLGLSKKSDFYIKRHWRKI